MRKVDAAIVALSLGLGSWLVVSADRYVSRRLHIEGANEGLAALQPLFWRMDFDLTYVTIAATLGAAALLAVDRRTWTRRGLARPGTVAVLVSLLFASIQFAGLHLVRGRELWSGGFPYRDLRNNLYQGPSGSILGAWLILALLGLWRPSRDPIEWLGRLVGFGWLGGMVVLLAYPILFG